MTDDLSNSTLLQVIGVDLGPACHNRSTGVLVARKESGQWKISRSHEHRERKRDHADCNRDLAKVIRRFPIAVVDAPLCLGSSKKWEKSLQSCEGLTDSMLPSASGTIGSHMWRAAALLPLLEETTKLYEIFPAAWFWLCDFDEDVSWKGDTSAIERKLSWFESVVKKVNAKGVHLAMSLDSPSGDEADALPCVVCAILIAEGMTLERLDSTEPPVLFPPKFLWDKDDLPHSVRDLCWTKWSHTSKEEDR